MNAAHYLPDKYNEIMNLMSNRELRVYLPIQELNILLEPVEQQTIDDDEELDIFATRETDDKQSNQDSSSNDEEEKAESEDSIIEVDENSNEPEQDELLSENSFEEMNFRALWDLLTNKRFFFNALFCCK